MNKIKFITEIASTHQGKVKDLYKIQNVKIKKKFKNQNLFSISIDKKRDFLNLKKLFYLKGNIKVGRLEILKFLNKNLKRNKLRKKIPLKTKKYNAKYKFDTKKNYIIVN